MTVKTTTTCNNKLMLVLLLLVVTVAKISFSYTTTASYTLTES